MSTEGRDNQDGLVSLLVGLGVGIILGGATALLLAPQAGTQTRAQLKNSVDDTLGKLRDSMDDLRVKVDEVATSAREAMHSRRAGEPDALTGDVAGATDEGLASSA